MVSLRLALIASVVAILVLHPCQLYAQAPQPTAGDDPTTFHPFDLKQGCWEVRQTTSISGFFAHVSPDFYKNAFSSATPARLAQYAAGLNANIDQQNSELKKPHVKQTLACNQPQGFQMLDPGTIAPLQNLHCKESLHSTTRELHRIKTCTADGGARSTLTSDYTSSDSEHFQAATRAERQALLRKVRQKYRMTVVDPDFFAGAVDW